MRRHGPEGRTRSSGVHPEERSSLFFLNPQPSTAFQPVTNDSMRQLNPRFCRLAHAAGSRFSGTCRDRRRQNERQLSPRSVFSLERVFASHEQPTTCDPAKKHAPTKRNKPRALRAIVACDRETTRQLVVRGLTSVVINQPMRPRTTDYEPRTTDNSNKYPRVDSNH